MCSGVIKKTGLDRYKIFGADDDIAMTEQEHSDISADIMSTECGESHVMEARYVTFYQTLLQKSEH